MKFLEKNAINLSTNWNFKYFKPSICPYCGIGTDLVVREKTAWSFTDNATIFIATGACTACGKIVLFSSEVKNGASTFATMYPIKTNRFESDLISSVSPRFIDMYNQALDAEGRGSIELASTGFRSALEILIKDYAINELNKPKEEVAQKKLFHAIGEYLEQDSLTKSADVVRILGNDYTHYERKYPEHDFQILKKYMQIFIDLIESKLMALHPPVSR